MSVIPNCSLHGLRKHSDVLQNDKWTHITIITKHFSVYDGDWNKATTRSQSMTNVALECHLVDVNVSHTTCALTTAKYCDITHEKCYFMYFFSGMYLTCELNYMHEMSITVNNFF